MSNLTTCIMKEQDLESVLEINNLCFSPPWTISALKNELKNKFSKYLILKLANKVIGYAGIWIIIDEAHITNIAIHPDFRGIGGSDVLMNSIIDICKENRIPAITLEVRENNFPAVSLYKKYNFIQEGLRKDYYGKGINAILMWKRDFL